MHVTFEKLNWRSTEHENFPPDGTIDFEHMQHLHLLICTKIFLAIPGMMTPNKENIPPNSNIYSNKSDGISRKKHKMIHSSNANVNLDKATALNTNCNTMPQLANFVSMFAGCHQFYNNQLRSTAFSPLLPKSAEVPPRLVTDEGSQTSEMCFSLEFFIKQIFEEEGVVFNKDNSKAIRKQVDTLSGLIVELIKEIARNRANGRHYFEKAWGRSAQINKTFHRNCQPRVDLLQKMCCLLFKASSFDDVLAYLVTSKKDIVPDIVRDIHGLNMTDFKLSCFQACSIKFSVGCSYTQLHRFGHAVSKYTDSFVKFPSERDIRTFRKTLSLPEIKILKNSAGRSVGRYWPFIDMVPRCMENREVVAKCEFPVIDNQLTVVCIISGDGCETSSAKNTLSVLNRFANLRRLAQQPGNVQIIAMDEASESIPEFKSIFDQAISAGVKQFQCDGVPIICLEEEKRLLKDGLCIFLNAAEREASECAGCRLEIPAVQRSRLDDPSKIAYYHMGKLDLVVVQDGKAQICCTPLLGSQCLHCKVTLSEATFQAASVNSLKTKRDKHTLEEWQMVQDGMVAACQSFLESKTSGFAHLLSTAQSETEYMTQFWDSDEFKLFQNVFGKR